MRRMEVHRQCVMAAAGAKQLPAMQGMAAAEVEAMKPLPGLSVWARWW